VSEFNCRRLESVSARTVFRARHELRRTEKFFSVSQDVTAGVAARRRIPVQRARAGIGKIFKHKFFSCVEKGAPQDADGAT
jgi:hypothetical protein